MSIYKKSAVARRPFGPVVRAKASIAIGDAHDPADASSRETPNDRA